MQYERPASLSQSLDGHMSLYCSLHRQDESPTIVRGAGAETRHVQYLLWGGGRQTRHRGSYNG